MQVNDKLFEEDAVYHHRCYINFFNYKKNIDGTTLVLPGCRCRFSGMHGWPIENRGVEPHLPVPR